MRPLHQMYEIILEWRVYAGPLVLVFPPRTHIRTFLTRFIIYLLLMQNLHREDYISLLLNVKSQ
jgi:hypothetical protein